MGWFDRWRQVILGTGSATGRAPRTPDSVADPATGTAASMTDGPALCAEGHRLLSAGQASAALGCFQQALDAPGVSACEAHLGQALAQDALGATQDALDSLEIAHALDPANVDVLLSLARLLRECGQPAEAEARLQQAITLSPARADVRTELGLVASLAGDLPRAMQAYRDAIERAPQDPAPMINLGLLHLQQEGDAAAAEAWFRRALEVSPAHVAALANLGLALHDAGRYDEAFELYAQGLALHPDHVELRWNRALAHLSIGHYEAGWPDYELRLVRAGGRRTEAFPLPAWRGQPLPDGGLLVLAEQGLGDEIMFASCLEDVRARVGQVVLECAPRLERLFRRSFPQIEVRGVERGSRDPWYAAYPNLRAKTCIGSLPGVFRNARAAFPSRMHYLVPDDARVARWRTQLRGEGVRAVVGVSWRGGTPGTRGALRSLSLAMLAPMFDLPGIRFVSLQHGLTVEERALLDAHRVVVADDANDIDELAALIAAADRIVTVANTSAHLAGALGRPVWIWLNDAPEWRWLRSGSACPWYPSATLCRADGAIGPADVFDRTRALAAEWDAGGTGGR